MARNDAFTDVDDSISCSTIESDEIDVKCHRKPYSPSNGIVLSQHSNSFDGLRRSDKTLILPDPTAADKTSIAHISSVALQNSTDVTFGNKTLYNGPITVNQYGFHGSNEANTEQKTKPLFKRLSVWKILITIFISTFILLSAVVVLTLHFTADNTNDISAVNIDNDHTELRMVKREEWRAKPTTSHLEDFKLPARLVLIQHTVTPSCEMMETCAPIVRQIQKLHIALEDSIGDDIGYNFLVGGDGAAYEGRGWNKIGAHTAGYNSKSIGVAFIGDFRHETPPKRQLIALLKLIRDGVRLKKISENYTLIGANQVHQTESPGKLLIQILTKLPHWSDQID